MKDKKSPFKLREMLSELNKNEVDTGQAKGIPESKIDKIFNSIAHIKINSFNGTGFFLKLEIKPSEFYFFVTCEHVISKSDVSSKDTILISYGKKMEKFKKKSI